MAALAVAKLGAAQMVGAAQMAEMGEGQQLSNTVRRPSRCHPLDSQHGELLQRCRAIPVGS